VDATELLATVLEEQGPRAAAKGQRLELGVGPDTLPFLADAMHLKEVVDNLVSNAIKFTPPGPPERHIQVRVGRGWLEVQDQGPGFLPEEIAHAFGRFERLSARPTGGETSTGLGLSIVHALVEAMGGTIRLSSEPGQGATFHISLPVEGP
jgi:signal transduction histidine kinase